jgi:hypothetical protein
MGIIWGYLVIYGEITLYDCAVLSAAPVTIECPEMKIWPDNFCGTDIFCLTNSGKK